MGAHTVLTPTKTGRRIPQTLPKRDGSSEDYKTRGRANSSSKAFSNMSLCIFT